MNGTRSEILNYLEDHPRSAAAEIAHFLEMTPANIRYHLKILANTGQVQVAGKRSSGGAGRPILLYTICSQILGNNLAPLLGAVLDWIQTTRDTEMILEGIASQLAGSLPAGINRVQRFNQAIYTLNDFQYHASWEARPAGPRVTLRHCPYGDLAQEQPLICQLDEALISRLFATDLTLTNKRSFGKNPFSPCQFDPCNRQEEKRTGISE